MGDLTFFDGARWLLRRLLVALLAVLAVAVVARQFIDVEGDASAPSPAATGPLIGDHWHASYVIVVCDEALPPVPQWLGGVHTHSDGVIHIHPLTASEQGLGARLVKWFEYGGGKLTQTEMRVPGDRRELKNGDACPDGSQAVLQLFVNNQPMDDWSDYIPQDGDGILIVFGSPVGE